MNDMNAGREDMMPSGMKKIEELKRLTQKVERIRRDLAQSGQTSHSEYGWDGAGQQTYSFGELFEKDFDNKPQTQMDRILKSLSRTA